MKKKWYTLVELIIVVAIVWILMVAFRGIFEIKNRENLYGEACINNLYGEVSNYMYAAITSRALLSGANKIYPDFYAIEFETYKNQINFLYMTWSTRNYLSWSTRKSLGITGNVPSNYNCKTNSYNITMSGWINWPVILLVINKWLSEDTSLRSIYIDDPLSKAIFTWEVKFLLIDAKWAPWYKELGKFSIDTRTQNIKNDLCMNINITWSCAARSN